MEKGIIISLLFWGIMMISCSSEEKMYGHEPNNLISQDKMVAILTDMQEAEGVMAIKINGDLNRTTTQKNIYQKAILQKHGVSQIEFWQNYKYYTDNPMLLDTIYAQVIKKLEKQMPSEKERMAKNPLPVSTPPVPNMEAKPTVLGPNSMKKAGKSE